ncbi:hypothetical protein ACQ4PT_054704 [Festuca glaucescens]
MAPPPPQENSRSESVPVVELAPAPPPSVVVVTVDVLTAASELNLQQQKEEDEGKHQVWHYLDVRTGEEMAKGHLHNSHNVPYMFLTPQGKACTKLRGTREKNPEFVEQVSSLFRRDQHILVGCQSGKRSEMACVDLLAAGFVNVKNVGGGYIAWAQTGLPILVPAHCASTTSTS